MRLQRVRQRIPPGREARPARERQVAVETHACACAALVRIAEIVGIFGVRIAVDAGELHIRALVEDGLRAVAVVVVDVEHGDALHARVAQRLRGNGGVVEEAVAPEEIRAGMVARRAREGEGRALSLQHARGSGHRTVRARSRGPPGARRQRRARVVREQAHPCRKACRQHIGAKGPDRPVGRQGIAPGIGRVHRHPLAPCLREKVDIARRVYASDGRIVERVRCFDLGRTSAASIPPARSRRAPALRNRAPVRHGTSPPCRGEARGDRCRS